MVICIFLNPYACKKAIGGQKTNKKFWPQMPILHCYLKYCMKFQFQFPKRPLSRWEMLSPNDFLGQNWIFEARKGCVFFEKSCPKLTILLQNDPFSHLTPGSWCTQGKRSTHYKWRTRFEWRTRKPASSHKPTPASHPLAPWSPWGGDHRSQVLCSWDIWT